LLARTARIAAALATGAMLHFTLGLQPIAGLMWLAPLPLLVAAFCASAAETRGLALLAGVVGVSGNFSYYATTSHGVLVPFLIIALQSLAWNAVIRRTRATVIAAWHWTAPLIYPTAWAALDLMINTLSPHGSWGSLAYTQWAFPPVLQIAALAGTPGVVFVLGLPASTLAVALTSRGRVAKPWLAYGLPAAIVLVALSYGTVRIATAPRSPTMTVGLTAIDDFLGPRIPKAAADAVWAQYDATIAALATQGARVVALPEKIDTLNAADADALRRHLGQLARQHGIYLLAGFAVETGAERRNVAWLFDPSGKLSGDYAKQHPVPQLENNITAGQQSIVRTVDGVGIGLAVCADLMFPALGRSYGRQSVAAVFAPAWDFGRDGAMAAGIAALRGVEGGYSVVRVAREGRLSVTDRYGRFIADYSSAVLPGNAAIALLPLTDGTTLYAWIGDLFGYLCLFTITFLWRRTATA
jgi:apolipoprotein N-acyltransferase